MLPALGMVQRSGSIQRSAAPEAPAAKVYRGGWVPKAERDESGNAKAVAKKAKAAEIAQAHLAAKRAKYAPYEAHMAGEVKSGELKGGHLLDAMKTAFPNLHVSALPATDTQPWGAYWHDGIHAAKWSSFFPKGWTKTDFLDKCVGGTVDIHESGKTMYPSGFPEPDGAAPALHTFVKVP